MGDMSYWYKKTLQGFVQSITDVGYGQLSDSVLESEELLENLIRERRQNMNSNEFYFTAGIITDQIISESTAIGNDTANAAMIAICSFMEFIGLESEVNEGAP